MLARRSTIALVIVGLGVAAGAVPAKKLASTTADASSPHPVLTLVGDYSTGLGELSGETVALEGDLMFVTNAAGNSLDIVDVSVPSAPTLLNRVSLAPYGAAPNSVDVDRGRVAVAMEADPKTDPGTVVFFDTSGQLLDTVGAGALPDMLTFTPNGHRLVVVNEGEPSGYGVPGTVDPEGSLTIVDTPLGSPPGNVAGNVKHVEFTDFNVGGGRHGELPAGLRLYGPGATVAQDIEPEYAAVAPDSKTAYVSLQENNGMAVIKLSNATVQEIRALGLKDHNALGNGLDASDRDLAINIARWPVKGMYEPDAVSVLTVGADGKKNAGTRYLVTANEGDARDWPGLAEEIRVGAGGYPLDPTVFPTAATLKLNANLGRLNVSRSTGDTDNDGDYDEIHVFGARSFSVWDADNGALVADSGDVLEQVVATVYPTRFNVSNNNNTFDDRSDNKGPEPEGITTAVIDGVPYVFVGLERQGGIMMFDLSTPSAPAFVQYANNRNYNVLPAGPDSGPEVLHFVAAADSPTGNPLVLAAHEISGTVAIYELQ